MSRWIISDLFEQTTDRQQQQSHTWSQQADGNPNICLGVDQVGSKVSTKNLWPTKRQIISSRLKNSGSLHLWMINNCMMMMMMMMIYLLQMEKLTLWKKSRSNELTHWTSRREVLSPCLHLLPWEQGSWYQLQGSTCERGLKSREGADRRGRRPTNAA